MSQGIAKNLMISTLLKPSVIVSGKKYKIITQIGEGAFGYVYHVKSTHTSDRNESYALKKMICQTSEQVAEAKREIDVMLKIQHANILPLLSFSYVTNRKAQEEVYLLMPLYYKSVQGIIDEGPGYPYCSFTDGLDVVKIIRHSIEGLLALHDAGFRHADFKPGNILVTEAFHAVLTDFGSVTPLQTKITSRSDALEVQDHAITHTTASYRSPELYDCPSSPSLSSSSQGTSEVFILDGRCDVWSLGVTIYTMFYSRTPFESSVAGLSTLAIMSGQYSIPEEANNNIWPREYLDVIKDCLTVKMTERLTLGEVQQRMKRIGVSPPLDIQQRQQQQQQAAAASSSSSSSSCRPVSATTNITTSTTNPPPTSAAAPIAKCSIRMSISNFADFSSSSLLSAVGGIEEDNKEEEKEAEVAAAEKRLKEEEDDLQKHILAMQSTSFDATFSSTATIFFADETEEEPAGEEQKKNNDSTTATTGGEMIVTSNTWSQVFSDDGEKSNVTSSSQPSQSQLQNSGNTSGILLSSVASQPHSITEEFTFTTANNSAVGLDPQQQQQQLTPPPVTQHQLPSASSSAAPPSISRIAPPSTSAAAIPTTPVGNYGTGSSSPYVLTMDGSSNGSEHHQDDSLGHTPPPLSQQPDQGKLTKQQQPIAVVEGQQTDEEGEEEEDEFGEFTGTYVATRRQSSTDKARITPPTVTAGGTATQTVAVLSAASSSGSTAVAAKHGNGRTPAPTVASTNDEAANTRDHHNNHEDFIPIDFYHIITLEASDSKMIIKQGTVSMMRLGGFPTRKMVKKQVWLVLTLSGLIVQKDHKRVLDTTILSSTSNSSSTASKAGNNSQVGGGDLTSKIHEIISFHRPLSLTPSDTFSIGMNGLAITGSSPLDLTSTTAPATSSISSTTLKSSSASSSSPKAGGTAGEDGGWIRIDCASTISVSKPVISRFTPCSFEIAFTNKEDMNEWIDRIYTQYEACRE